MMRAGVVTPIFVTVHVVALHVSVAYFGTTGTTEAPLSESQSHSGEPPSAASGRIDDRTTAGPPDSQPPDAPSSPLPSVGAGLLDIVYDPPGALDLQHIATDDEGRLVAQLGNGWTAELTTRPKLQAAVQRILARGRVPLGAVVLVEPTTGHVLAMADRFDESHEAAPTIDPDGPSHLALRAIAPAASVFKIITAAALLESGVSPKTAWRYRKARRRIRRRHLGDPRPDAPRQTLGEALARSNNGLFARLSTEKLSAEHLRETVARFGFNRVLPFPLLTSASTARVPGNPLERARMAAGFWHSRLTPLHGALIAAAVANKGVMPAPRLVARVRNPDGEALSPPDRAPLGAPMKPRTARALTNMLRLTTTTGTGRRAFSKRRKSLVGVSIAGKSGTLATRDPYMEYTWFVGFAPADNPKVAFAVLVGNGTLWHVRATEVARDVLAAYFKLSAPTTLAAL